MEPGFSTDDALRFLRSPRSVRRYSVRDVDDVTLRRVLEVARWTGSGKNQQPWHFIVVRDAEVRAQLSGLGPFASQLAQAPVGIALAMTGDPFVSDFDEGRVAQSIVLTASALGVASCMVFLEPPENRAQAGALLGVPDTHRVRSVIALGYEEPTADRFEPDAGPRRAAVLGMLGRRPLEDVVSYETFGNPSPRGAP